MVPGLLLTALSIGYLGLLFAVAFYGESRSIYPGWARLRPYIYSLALGVYCTTWTFFGAVGTAVRDGWAYLPIYLGPALVFLLATPFLQRLVAVARSRNTTSIADLISARFGKSPALAALVALMALTAAVPYLALQYKAVGTSIDVLTGSAGRHVPWFADTALLGRPADGDLRHAVRHQAPGRDRAPRGRDARHCFRVRREAARFRDGRRVRRAAHRACAGHQRDAARQSRYDCEREFPRGNAAGSRSNRLPAAAVPGRHRRVCRPGRPQQGALAVLRLSRRVHAVRRACRAGGAGRRPRRPAPSRLVRPHAADGERSSGDRGSRVPRRAVGGDRNGDRRKHRARHDDHERPDNASAVAQPLAGPQPGSGCRQARASGCGA